MAGSVITVTYDGTEDISNSCIFAQTQFEQLSAAAPGQATIRVRDFDQSLSFVTGKSIEMTLDGKEMWTGFITNVGRGYAAPVLDTTVPAEVTGRIWILRCTDLNVLFDKRVLRNPSSYTTALPDVTTVRYDGDLIRNELVNFLDIADDNIDFTSEVDDIVPPMDPELLNDPILWGWNTQGSKWRDQMQDFANFSGAVWYIAPSRKLHYKALEDSVPSWGFSDVPNGTTTIGFREMELQEDISQMVNDAFIWGGAGWAGGDTIVFARETNETSVADHSRWQLGEIHFGQDNYKTQANVTARAQVIVDGAPGAVPGEPARGLSYPQFNARLVWHSTDVPNGEHLVPGQIVPITLYVHGPPLVLNLPLRRLTMTFPTLDPDGGDPYVRFEANFSLQLSDPKLLWDFILRQQAAAQNQVAIATANASSPSAIYGAMYSDAPLQDPDGSRTVFSLNPAGFSYIAGTTEVYKNGLFQLPQGIDYAESDPLAGEITFTSAPSLSDELWIICRLGNSTLAIHQPSFRANAVLKKTQSASFTADAVIA